MNETMNTDSATGTALTLGTASNNESLTPERIITRYKKSLERRQAWESHWRECYDFALPRREGAIVSGQPGEKKTDKLFDGTAPDAVEQLAASLLSELTPPWARWFGLVSGHELSEQESSSLGPELERISKVLQSNFDRSNFAVEMHQCYLDLVTAGTASLLMEEASITESSALRFTAVPLSQVVFEESIDGRLDTTFRRSELTPEQLKARFPQAPLGRANAVGHGLNEKALKEMMGDPRYWRDNDSAYIERVRQGFQALYPEN